MHMYSVQFMLHVPKNIFFNLNITLNKNDLGYTSNLLAGDEWTIDVIFLPVWTKTRPQFD